MSEQVVDEEVELQINEACELINSFTSCNECSVALEPRLRKEVRPRGRLDAPIVIVGEAPGKSEEEFGKVFVGEAGRILEKMLEDVGVNKEDIYITNTLKCRPTDNRDPTSTECQVCRKIYLAREIGLYPHKLIITLGNFGHYGIIPKGSPSGITKKAGLFVWSEEFECYILPSLHPAALLRNPKYATLIEDVVTKVQTFIGDGHKLPPQKSVIYKEVRDLVSFWELMREIREAGKFVVDLETTGFDWWNDRILCMSFSTASQTGWYLPLEEDGVWIWPREDWTAIQEGLRQIFEDPEIGKMGFNVKFDLKFLVYNFGWELAGSLDDPMLMHYLLDENTPHGLKGLASRFTSMGDYSAPLDEAFNTVKRSRIPVTEKHYGKIPSEILKTYAMMDADATNRIYDIFLPQLKQENLYTFYRRSMMPVLSTLMEMEMTGIRVDRARMSDLETDFEYKLNEIQNRVNEIAGEEVNVKSAKQLVNLLYVQLRLPILKRTAKGSPSTDEETLGKLQEKTGHEVLDKIIEHRKNFKIYGTYIVGLLKVIATDGRLHTSYLQHGTVSGRLSSSRPALQNIPRDSTVKSLFVPEEDWYLISADYGQHEVRVWANYSQDEALMETLASGDVHDNIGAMLLNKPPEQISYEERVFVKACEFGLMYGMGTYTLAQDNDMTIEQAEEFYNLFFSMFPKATKWLEDIEKFAHTHGYVRNTFGRVRRLPDIRSGDEQVVAAAERQARNSPIQSAASDITNLALTRINKAFKRENMQARLLLQVHDEILSEAPADEIHKAVEIVEREMLAPIPGFNCPLSVDAEVVVQWGGKPIDLSTI